jgi:DNA-binding NtrC family response regulator
MNRNAKILVVDDESSLRLLLVKELTREGFTVEAVVGGVQALTRLAEERFNIVLLDIVMPELDGVKVLSKIREESYAVEVIMLTGNATVESAIECMKLGAFEYIRKPYELKELVIHIERALQHQRSKLDIEVMQQELRRGGYRGNLIGKSRSLMELRKMIERVAPTQSTVLVLGESGTGKEVVARSIHDSSDRSDKQFVAINCASFSETLLESELFGYEKGAFTDAKAQKRGLAEIADGGTLFLDEIGEIPMRFQAKLLRFLETGEIRRVGGTRDIKLNVRILCATNQPLAELIARNEFREDLFYRLNVLSLRVPALRQHQDDIPLLVDSFLQQLGFNKRFDKSALEVMRKYPWPGNVRELKNLVERVCIMCQGDTVQEADLDFLQSAPPLEPHGARTQPMTPVADNGVRSPLLSLEDVERDHIVAVLKHVNGHKGRAAEILKINPKTLYNKILAYNIVSEYK